MAIYDHYQVIGSKITVQSVFADQTSTTGVLWGVKLSDASGTQAGRVLESIMETKGVAKRLSLPNSDKSAFTRPQKCVMKYSPKRMFGKNFTITDRNQGNKNSNPEEKAYFEIFVCPMRSNSSGTKQCHFILTIDYLIKYTERKALDRS